MIIFFLKQYNSFIANYIVNWKKNWLYISSTCLQRHVLFFRSQFIIATFFFLSHFNVLLLYLSLLFRDVSSQAKRPMNRNKYVSCLCIGQSAVPRHGNRQHAIINKINVGCVCVCRVINVKKINSRYRWNCICSFFLLFEITLSKKKSNIINKTFILTNIVLKNWIFKKYLVLCTYVWLIIDITTYKSVKFIFVRSKFYF